MSNIQSQGGVVIRYVFVGVITLTFVALIAEMLPEVHAKPIVVAALSSSLAIMLTELFRIRRSDTNYRAKG